MSSKRVPRANRKGRGRIKYDYDLSKLGFDKVHVDARPVCSKTVLQENSQDVVQNTHNVESSNELEITNATNFSLPNHTEMVQDIVGVNVDDWLKRDRTESVSSIDLEVAMKNEIGSDGIDTSYLTDNISNHFLTNKDVDMTYVVTNICDMGLGLDLPTSTSSRPKKKSESFTEKDCDILSNYSSNQDPLLDALNKSDLLDKDILDENAGIHSHKIEFLDIEKQNLFYVIGVNKGQYTSVDNVQTVTHKKHLKDFKENLWNGSVITDAQTSEETNKDKSNWESLSNTSKRSIDADSEKEIDFPELNSITFQVGATDAVCNVAQLPLMPVEFNTSTSDDSGKVIQNSNKITTVTADSLSSLNISKNDISVISSEVEKISNASPNNNTETVIKNVVAPTSNPRSLLKSPLKAAATLTKKPNILKKTASSRPPETTESSTETSPQEKKTKKKSSSMAIIAISTDKSKNTTEIIINTPFGEQVFKGKTTDLMKATSGLWQKIDSNKLQKTDNPLIFNMENNKDQSSSALEEEEQPVTEALAELGIDLDNNNIGLTTVAGQRVWFCPFKGCGKVCQRQCMLKVHILSHFNVRPYRCNYAGCHWSFYTYFKLKRHKETHLKKKDFVCTIQGCERRFTTIYNLNAHQKMHERPLEMICPVEACAARFPTKRSLELHMRNHDKQHAPYKCTHEGCGKHYYSLNALKSHLRSHQHKEEDVRCQWEGCGKLFDKPCRLKAHMLSHTGDKPYPCEYKGCGWAFSSASKLKRHQHKHTNERKFQCVVEGCGKSFMRSEHLKEHSLTHVGQRNFQCPFESCGVKFSAKSSLYVHLKKHSRQDSAVNKVMYHCPIEKCVRTYACKSNLRQHMLKFHTPVLASGPSQLDHITFLAGDEDLSTLEGLQFSDEIARAAGSLNTVSLVTNPSVLMNGDTVNNGASDIVATDLGIPGLIPAQVCTSASTSTSLSNNVITHVLLTPPDNQNSILMVSNPTMSSVETSSDSGVTTDQPLNMFLFEPENLDVEPETDSTLGSARTSYTYQNILKEKERRKANLSPIQTPSMGMKSPTDVVLGTGLYDIPHGLLLQDDLTSNHQNLYTEDQLMAVSPGAGEYQVLLLDPNSQHEFAESTINLRDLE